MRNFNIKSFPKYYQVACAGWLSRAVTGVSQVVAIAITLHLLGVHLYAVFAIITGLQGWFNLLDYGIGSGLQNYISEFQAKSLAINKLLANALITIISLLFITVIIFFMVAPLAQFLLLYHIAPEFSNTHYGLLAVSGGIFIATTLFSISYRVLFALHKGYWAYLYQGLGSIISIIFLLLIQLFGRNNDSLMIILLAWLVPNLVVAVVGFFQCFSLKGLTSHFDLKMIKKILGRGFGFWGFAVAAALTLLIDYIVMSQTLKAQDITIYNILFKGFAFVFCVYNAVLVSIWPEVAELFIKKQWDAANKIVMKNLRQGLVFMFFCTALILLTRHWIIVVLGQDKNFTLPVTAILLFGFYFLIRVWTDTYAMVLQSQNYLKVFWLIVPIQAILSASGMWVFSIYYGLDGILWGLIFSFLLTVTWILPIVYYRRRALYSRLG